MNFKFEIKTPKHTKKKEFNYSKALLNVISTGFIIVILWAITLITINFGALEYIHVPVEVSGLVMTGGVVGYLVKSAKENVTKIESNPEYLSDEEENEEII